MKDSTLDSCRMIELRNLFISSTRLTLAKNMLGACLPFFLVPDYFRLRIGLEEHQRLPFGVVRSLRDFAFLHEEVVRMH